MKRNRPVVSTAKVRGMIKKNDINYVDATRKYYPTIANGVHVWQLCDSVYFRVFGYGEDARIQNNLEKFIAILDAEGFTVKSSSNNSYQIVAKIGA